MIAITLPQIDAMDDTMRAEPMPSCRVAPPAPDLTSDAAMANLRAAQAAHPRLAANLTPSPAERRIEHFLRAADAYALRCTQGMGCTAEQRRFIGQKYLIGLLTAAFLADNRGLSRALEMLEQNARDAFVVGGIPADQEGFEAAWANEDPAGYREWLSLRVNALRVL